MGAVWQQLVEFEALGAGGGPEDEARASVLTDLVKCFERVRLHHVWHWGLVHRMPPKLLQMILVTYAMARRISVQGSYSDSVCTVTAIVPGSAFALMMLHAVLLHPCDVVVRRWPGVEVAKFVDDLALTAFGKGRKVVDDVVECVEWLCGYFNCELQLEVSLDSDDKKGKTVALASNMWVRRQLEAPMRAMGIGFKSRAKNLGVDMMGAGPIKLRGKASRTKRADANLARISRLRAAARSGGLVHKVVLRGLKPSMQYGHKAIGLPPSHALRMQRLIADSLPGRHHGRSRHLRLAMFDCDPAPGLTADTIGAWAAAVWDETVSSRTLQKAWRQ